MTHEDITDEQREFAREQINELRAVLGVEPKPLDKGESNLEDDGGVVMEEAT